MKTNTRNALSKVGLVLAVIAGVFGVDTDASAQQAGLVNVDLRNARVLNNVARDINVAVSNVPVTVQLPISIAANVCQVQVAVLALALQRGGSSCYAQNNTVALNRAVQRVMAVQQ